MGTPGVTLLCIAAFMGISTGLNGFYMAGSRVLLAMSRAGMVPQAFGHHPKYKTPGVGVLFAWSQLHCPVVWPHGIKLDR